MNPTNKDQPEAQPKNSSTQPQIINPTPVVDRSQSFTSDGSLGERQSHVSPDNITQEPNAFNSDSQQNSNNVAPSAVSQKSSVPSPVTASYTVQTPSPIVMPDYPNISASSETEKYSPNDNLPIKTAFPSSMADETNVDGTKNSKKSKRAIIAVICAVIIVGLAGSAFAYVNIMNNSPEKVLADALANTFQDTFDQKPVELVSKIEMKNGSSQDALQISVDLNAKHKDDNGELVTNVQIKSGSDFNITISANIIIQRNDVIYIKLNNLDKTVNQVANSFAPNAIDITQFKPLIEKIDNKWIRVDKQSMQEYGFEQYEETINKCSESLNNLRLTNDDKKKIKEIFKNNQFAIVSEEYPDEMIGGMNSYHYKLDLNTEEGSRFVSTMIELNSFSDIKTNCGIKEDDAKQKLNNLESHVDKESKLKPIFELWVSKNNRRITKGKVNVQDKEMSFDWTTQTKYGQIDNINIPEKSISIKELKDEIDKLLSTRSESDLTKDQNTIAW